MGGKNKQRTKNNVRPSSSGRSADQLTAVSLEGATLPGLFPTLVAPTIDTHLTTELQLCFKKFNKKDPITKAKALQELIELVPQSKVDDIVAALPTWTHFYKILTADPDRKVRELTQCCHGAVVSSCGRRVAPHLKQLMPAWLQAQYDDHPPARSHAAASLQKTFPDNKLPEVLAFCKEEVMAHILDILIKNGDNAFVRKCATPEEAAAERARAAAGALAALRYVVLRGEPGWLAPHLAQLLDANAFWKYAASADVTLRAAWFACVGALSAGGALAPRHVGRALRAATAQREAAPRVAAQLWGALLAIMNHIPNWHEHLEKKELFCKRVLEVLESGGWGEARQLSALLLPLLASLPEQLLTEHFYNSFFDALLAGLEKKSVSNSRSEVWCWTRSVEECVRYVSVHKEQETALIARVVRQWTSAALTAPKVLLHPTASALGALSRHWRRKQLLALAAWRAVGAALGGGLPEGPPGGPPPDPAEVARTIQNHTAFLRALRDPTSPLLKSVRFDETPSRTPFSSVPTSSKLEESSTPGSSKPVSWGPSPPASPGPDSLASIPSLPASPEPDSPGERDEYLHRLTEIVISMTVRYLELARDEAIPDAVITPLVPLLQDFASAEVFEGISSALGLTSPLQLYLTLVRTWLSSDSMRCKALVQLTFLMMKYLTEEDQDVILKSLDSMSGSVAEWALGECARAPAGPARRWARGPAAGGAARALAARALGGSAPAADLLVQCFKANSQEDAMLSPSAVNEVVKLVVRAVEEAWVAGEGEEEDEGVCEEEDEGVGRVEGAAALCARLAGAAPPPDALLLALVRLSVHFTGREEDSTVSNRCAELVRSAWSRAARAEPGARLAARAAALVHHKLGLQSQIDKGNLPEPDTLTELNINEIQHITSLCPYFLDYSELDIQNLIQFSKPMLDIPSHPVSVEAFALRHDIVEGNLSCPFEDNDVSKAVINNTIDELTKQDVISYMSKVIFKTLYIETMLVHDDVDPELYNDILKETYFEVQLCNVLHEYMVVCALHKGYDYWKHYEIIERSKSQLDSSIDKLISEASPEVRRLILNKLTEEAVSKGYYWSYARKYFSDKIKSEENSEGEATETFEVKPVSEVKGEEGDCSTDAVDADPLARGVSGSGYFHTAQASGGAGGALACCARALLAAWGAERAVQDAVSVVQAAPGVDLVVDLIYKCPKIMLYDAPLAACPWSHVTCATAVVECLRHTVTSAGWAAPAHVWDAATLAAASLLQAAHRHAQHLGDTKIAALAVSTIRLLLAIEQFVAGLRAGRGPRAGSPAHVARLPAEWRDVFTPDIANNIYGIIVYMLDSSSNTAVRSTHIAVVKALRASIGAVKFPADAAPLRSPPRSPLRDAVQAASRALATPTPPPYKYLAYTLLEELLEPCVLNDAAALARWSESCGDEDEGAPRPRAEAEGAPRPPLTLQLHQRALQDMLDILDAATQHIRAGEETCSLEVGSDVHSLAVGLFLLADVLLRQGRLARGDLPHHYIQLYREGEYWSRLLTVSLRLLPRGALGGAAPAAWFAAAPGAARGAACGALACRAVFACVAGAGAAAARAWRAAAAPRAAAALDRLVEKYITPHVVREEFAALQARAADMEDTEIRVNPSTYEAWCRLTLDDKDMELHLRLSRSHPLAPPTLAAPNCPTSNTHWLMLYLTYQNGTVLNAMRMWTSSVTTKVERSTQCYICYCRLHPASGRLPAVTCHTCRNKFHNVCLRKWFSSSGKSHCPLCRTKF